ncbi:hypothetical protein ACIQD2_03185, partial [Dietzia maris]
TDLKQVVSCQFRRAFSRSHTALEVHLIGGSRLSDGAYYEAPLGGRFAEPGLPWVGEFKSLGRNKKTPKGVLYRTYHRIYFAEPHGPLPMVALVHYGVKQSHKREPGEQDRQIRKAMDKVGVLFDDAGWSYPTL